MSEKMFTRSEVEKALGLVIAGTTGALSQKDVNERLEGVSEELKVLVAIKLTEGLVNCMKAQEKQARKHSNPISEFFSQFEESRGECTCTKCTCRDEEPEIRIFKNGKPATIKDKEELFNLFKRMVGDQN